MAGRESRPPRFKVPFAAKIGAAIVLGCLTGVVLGPRAEVLGQLGILIIQLLKALATPLIFFAILDAFVRTVIRKRKGVKLVITCVINATVAGFIAISLSHLLPIGRYVDVGQLRAAMSAAAPPSAPRAELTWLSVVKSFVPVSLVEAFGGNQVLAVVFTAVLLGMALRVWKNGGINPSESETVERWIGGVFHWLTLALQLVVLAIPLAAFGVIAQVVGKHGFSVFGALGFFVGLVMLGLALHALVYYPLVLWFYARKSPLEFFKQGSEALLTAFATGSSLATLPVTLKTLQEKMKVSAESSRLAACVGTNLNNDGILLYEAVAALLVAQVSGLSLGLGDQVVLVVTSALAAMGIAGVPDAGLITLSLVLAAADLPLAIVPLLFPVDWLVGRMRATVNVTCDMMVAHVVEHEPKRPKAKAS